MKIEKDEIIQEKCLLQAINELGKGSKLLWVAFLLSIITSLVNALHTMSYIFVAEIPEHWCQIPELINANWTIEQVKNISTVDRCLKYNYDYAHLADLGYENAEKHIKNLKSNTSLVTCSSFVFDEDRRSTIVNEWSLVCDRQLYRANTYFIYSFGKLLGNGVLGILADYYGRKKALIIGSILLIIAVPMSSIVIWFWTYILCEFMIGISVGGMYSSGYTIMSEIANENKMKTLGIIIDILWSIGTFLLIVISYYITEWRNLQITLSLFTIPTIALVWCVEESPRWLISQNRHNEAQKIIEKYCEINTTPAFITEGLPLTTLSIDQSILVKEKHEKSCMERYLGNIGILFADPVYRKKILSMYFSFYVCVMVGFYLVFNIDNFKINRYVFLTGSAIIDILSLLLVSVILRFLSDQKTTIILYWVASICMLSIIATPKDSVNLILGLTVLSKFCSSASFTTNMLFSLKLFPSSVRNSALGTCLLMSQAGSMTAPYLVDFLGKVAPWSPTVLCSAALIFAGFLICIVPVKKSSKN